MPDEPTTKARKPRVIIETAAGNVHLELWPDVAPKHVESFLKLVGQGFYDGIVIHRVVPKFVLQAGDPRTKELPLSDPRIGSGGPGYTVPAEFSDKPHLRGTLSMARTNDPNSAGSQFFIVLERAPHLDHQYTVFGEVVGDGMSVVDQLQRGDKFERVTVVDAAEEPDG